jgi:hypothetical protein
VPGQQNTTYTETTLNNDHYWNIGTNEDGFHKRVSMKIFANSAIGAPVDAPIPPGLDGVFYLKTVAGTNQGFYRNGSTIFQFTPAFITGTTNINTGGYTDVVAVPNNTYGHVWMWRAGSKDVQIGAFSAYGGACQAISAAVDVNGNQTEVRYNVLYGNGTQVSGLNFRAKVASGAAGGTYEYRIMYWGA